MSGAAFFARLAGGEARRFGRGGGELCGDGRKKPGRSGRAAADRARFSFGRFWAGVWADGRRFGWQTAKKSGLFERRKSGRTRVSRRFGRGGERPRPTEKMRIFAVRGLLFSAGML